MLLFKEEGTTLIELMAAIVILAIVLTGAAILFSSSYASVVTAGWQSKALYEAQRQAETALAEGTVPDEMTSLVIGFSNIDIDVEGWQIPISQEYMGETVNLILFTPQR